MPTIPVKITLLNLGDQTIPFVESSATSVSAITALLDNRLFANGMKLYDTGLQMVKADASVSITTVPDTIASVAMLNVSDGSLGFPQGAGIYFGTDIGSALSSIKSYGTNHKYLDYTAEVNHRFYTGATPTLRASIGDTGLTLNTLSALSTAASYVLVPDSGLVKTRTPQLFANDIFGTCVRGDIITGQGVTPAWARLPKGTTGDFLMMGADEPAWATQADLAAIEAISTTGVLSRTASNTWATSSGTENYLPKFSTGGLILGNSIAYESSNASQYFFNIYKDWNNALIQSVINPNVGNVAYEAFLFGQTTTANIGMAFLNSGFTPSGTNLALYGYIYANNDTLGLVVRTQNAAAPLLFVTGGIAAGNERARFLGTGELGIGCTPKTWSTVFKVAQFGTSGSLIGYAATTNCFYIGENVYYGTGGTWKYINTGYAELSYQTGGAFYWLVAGSGSADANVPSWTTVMSASATGLSTALPITSTVATGTAPFAVSSTTVNPNLNSDLWNGYNLAAGTTNYLLKRTGAATVGDSIVSSSGTVVSITDTNIISFVPNYAGLGGIPAGAVQATNENINLSLRAGGAGATAGTIGIYANTGATNPWYSMLETSNVNGTVPNLLLIKSAGHIHIGAAVTAEAWATTVQAIQIGGNACLAWNNTAGADKAAHWGQNLYSSATGWMRQDVDEATLISQGSAGIIYFYTIISGNADTSLAPMAGHEALHLGQPAGETVFNDANRDINHRFEGSGANGVNLFTIDAGALTVNMGGSVEGSIATFGAASIALKQATTVSAGILLKVDHIGETTGSHTVYCNNSFSVFKEHIVYGNSDVNVGSVKTGCYGSYEHYVRHFSENNAGTPEQINYCELNFDMASIDNGAEYGKFEVRVATAGVEAYSDNWLMQYLGSNANNTDQWTMCLYNGGLVGALTIGKSIAGISVITSKIRHDHASAVVLSGRHTITATSGSASQSAAAINTILWKPASAAVGDYTLTLTGLVEGQLITVVNLDPCHSLIVKTGAGDVHTFNDGCNNRHGLLQYVDGLLRLMGVGDWP